MPPRLSALDASFLYLEQPTTPMHVGAVSIFRRPRAGFDYDRLVELVDQRISLVPRYRQKVRYVPGNLARPVWIDDPDFDVAYHVRRSALPKPGSDSQLTELVARLMSRPLDHTRPLWEMYLVEGLTGGRTAVVTKTHQAMVDGISAIDIGQVILDVSAQPRAVPEELWMPRPEPSAAELVVEALTEAVARPGEVIDNVRVAAGDAMATVGKLTGAFGQLFTIARTAVAPGPRHPAQRRHLHPAPVRDRAHAAGELPQDPRRARLQRQRCRAHRGVRGPARLAALARRAGRGVVAAAGDGAAVGPRPGRRAQLGDPGHVRQPGLVVHRGPAGRRAQPGGAAAPGHPRDAGVHRGRADGRRGHPGPHRRVRTPYPARTGRPRRERDLEADLQLGGDERAGTAVPALRRRRPDAGDVPGGAAGQGQALAIGLTSYDGGVCYGFNGDRDAMSDVHVLAGMVDEALDELLATVS
jgi:hypothetical protein